MYGYGDLTQVSPIRLQVAPQEVASPSAGEFGKGSFTTIWETEVDSWKSRHVSWTAGLYREGHWGKGGHF